MTFAGIITPTAQVVHRAIFSQTPYLQTGSIAHHAGGKMKMGWQYHYFPNDPTRRQRRTDLVAQRPNWTWNYNPRGEVTTASRESIAGQTWSYQYDAIGNRTSMKRSAAWVTSPDGTPSVSSVSQVDGAAFERVTATQANALNQIVAVDHPQSVELSGIASALATLELQVTPQSSAQNPDPAAVVAARPPNQNRPPASGEPDGWSHWLSDSSTASFGQWPKVKVKATSQSETLGTLVDEVEGRVWIKPDESPVYDPRGNLIQDGGWSYEWDARNRLLAAEMRPQHLPADLPQIRVEHLYDWLSRRVVTITKEKRVDTQTGARESVWRVLEHRHFWYDGWHLMAETVQGGTTGSVAAVTQRYIWGLDLAGDWERGMGQTRPQGSSTRTGGVGALLGVITADGSTYSVCNDANGNVMGFIDLETATLTARFDYDAFGNPITNWTAPGHPAPESITRVRFSSKHQDPHTGWLYYGYRWYDTEHGRWPSRDPIEEQGGVNLYGMVGNDPVNRWDLLGMASLTDLLEQRMLYFYNNHSNQVGSKHPNPPPGCTKTDCITYCYQVIEWAYQQMGQKAIADQVYKKRTMGTELAKYLQSIGWKAIYWNPDVKNPSDGQNEHPYSYAVAQKSGTYYNIPIAGMVINYRPTVIMDQPGFLGRLFGAVPTPSPKMTPKDVSGLNKLSKVRFGYGVAKGGMHTFLYGSGSIYEVHWTGLGTTPAGPGGLYEKSPFESYSWLSGAVLVPPDNGQY